MARYYRRAEWERLVSDFLSIKDVHIWRKKTELIPIPAGRVKYLLVRSIRGCEPVFHQHCGRGSFLVTKLCKEAV